MQAVIGFDPFNGLSINEIESVLVLLNKSSECNILAVPTSEYHDILPKEVYSVPQWYDILSQIGQVIIIYHCKYWCLFMVVK